MYPAIRLAKEFIRHRNAPKLAVGETHVTTLICWPWDIDVFMELNNGRTLTLYDLGRTVMYRRLGVMDAMKRKRWGGTVAGATVRYRARVRAFQKVELRTTMIGWDDRFNYVVQSMWRGDTCTSQALLRMAVTDKDGLVPAARVAEALDFPLQSPPLPDWVTAWVKAEGQRPWPPVQ
jgi:acyl-CoA thioesterase FadM